APDGAGTNDEIGISVAVYVAGARHGCTEVRRAASVLDRAVRRGERVRGRGRKAAQAATEDVDLAGVLNAKDEIGEAVAVDVCSTGEDILRPALRNGHHDSRRIGDRGRSAGVHVESPHPGIGNDRVGEAVAVEVGYRAPAGVGADACTRVGPAVGAEARDGPR